MSDKYIAASEKFEIVHKMSRRIASVDKQGTLVRRLICIIMKWKK